MVTSTEMYPEDTPLQSAIFDKLTPEVRKLIEQFTKNTGEGGQEITDMDGLTIGINSLLDYGVDELSKDFSDVDNSQLRQEVEKIVMREAMRFLSERKEVETLLQSLQISSSTKDAVGKVLSGGSLKEM